MKEGKYEETKCRSVLFKKPEKVDYAANVSKERAAYVFKVELIRVMIRSGYIVKV
jgi:hypothetical protein